MHRSTTIVAFLATIAIIAGCTTGGGEASPAASASAPAASASAPAGSAAASAPAASASGSAAGDSAACNPPRQEGVTLSFVSFGGVYQEAQRKAWLEPYTELTGVQFTEDENSSNATIQAQVESGQVTWDVVDVGNDFGLDANSALLEPLDFSLIPRDELNADLGITDYRIPDITYGVVLAYNTEVTGGQTPAGWADYFDTAKFPGKRGAWDYSDGRDARVRVDGGRRRARGPLPAGPPARARRSSTRSRTTSSSGPLAPSRRNSSAPVRSP